MFFGSEMNNPAMWTSEGAVQKAVRAIQKTTQKYTVIPATVYDYDGNLLGWVVFICEFSDDWGGPDHGPVTKGYIAALMQRHDIPLPDPQADPDMCVQIAPQFRFTPMYDELPKTGPSSIHVRW